MGFYRGPNIVTEDLIFAVDAASTRSYSGSGTNWVDLSGQGNNATLGSNVTYNAGGWMDFNGAQNTNSNVAVPISRGELGDNMSIEAFFRYDGAGNASYRPIVGGNDPGAGTEVFFGKNTGNFTSLKDLAAKENSANAVQGVVAGVEFECFIHV